MKMKWVAAILMATALMTGRLKAQTMSTKQEMQTAFAKDAGALSVKFSGLAHVMAGKYDWRPGQGVRSVGEVFNLIALENGVLSGVLSGSSNQREARPATITDPAQMEESLRTSYAKVQSVIAGLSDSDLNTHVKVLGTDMTKRDAIIYLFMDQHEHLGQSIAYARTNGISPPWSK